MSTTTAGEKKGGRPGRLKTGTTCSASLGQHAQTNVRGLPPACLIAVLPRRNRHAPRSRPSWLLHAPLSPRRVCRRVCIAMERSSACYACYRTNLCSLTHYAAQSNGRITSFPRTSVAKLLRTPSFQFGTSNVVVWHQGLRVSSFSMTRAKCSDQPLRGNLAVVVSIRRGWIKFARLVRNRGIS